MKTISVAKAAPAAINYLAAKAIGYKSVHIAIFETDDSGSDQRILVTVPGEKTILDFNPAGNDQQASSLIKQYHIGVEHIPDGLRGETGKEVWRAKRDSQIEHAVIYGYGETPEEAITRCLVESTFGPTADVPDELT